jgi:ABC-type branched-subunit amino acid transport system substrate-binding protein
VTHRFLVLGTAVFLVLAGAASAGAQTNGSTTTAVTTAPAAPTTTAPPARSATEGITATTIKVGGLGYSLLYGGADIGAKARFQRANDAGGVNGRKITYTGFTDDGGDPTADTAVATKLALQDRVFAVVPAVAADLTGASVFVRQRMPYFGWALSSTFCGNQYGFGFTGCLVPPRTTSNAWGTLIVKALGGSAAGKSAAILTEATPSGQYQLRALKSALASVKLKVAYGQSSLPVPGGADYTAVAKAVMTSNGGQPPSTVFVVGSISSVVGVQQALAAAGYAGIVTNPIEYGPNLVAPATGASVAIATAATETASSNPAMQQLIADVQKVAPGEPIDQAVIAGYFSADMFLAAVKKAGTNLSVDTLLKAANDRFTYSVPATVGPTRFPASHTQPTPCGSLVASNGTAYNVTVPYLCGKVVAVK